jgi:hypothetical protein
VHIGPPRCASPSPKAIWCQRRDFSGYATHIFSFGYGALPYPAIRFVHDRRSVLCGEAARPGRVLFQSADKVVVLQGIERGQPMLPRARQPDRRGLPGHSAQRDLPTSNFLMRWPVRCEQLHSSAWFHRLPWRFYRRPVSCASSRSVASSYRHSEPCNDCSKHQHSPCL